MRKGALLPYVSHTGTGRPAPRAILCAVICTAAVVFSVFSSPICQAAPLREASPLRPRLQTGDLHALVVGVSRYRDTRIPSLALGDKDAKAFGEFLESQKKLFKETHVTFLLNDQATKSSVEKFLYYTLHKTGKEDTIILFFSGHGAYDPVRPKDFLFLTYDAEPDYLGATAVKMSGLDFLKGIEAERVLIIADACYAGGFSEMKPKAAAPTLQLFLKEVRSSSGKAIITSGKEEQLSWEMPKLKNSVFTHHLIQGLKGKADVDHDGVVTLNEAYQYAYSMTKDVTGGRQHPQFEGKVVGAFPLSYVGPAVPQSELKQQILVKAKTGDREGTERLLVSGVDVNARDEENNSPLIISARHGLVEAVKLLLEHGADLEAKNHTRSTALAAAAENGHSQVVEVLLASRAHVNPKNSNGLTPLCLASQAGRLAVVKLLLSKGADSKGRTNVGKTALILAASQGHLQVVKLLRESGSDVDVQDLEGATALTEAARNGHGPVVEYLVRNGADITAKGGRFLDKQLILACLSNNVARAREVLLLGANADSQTECGDTALALASGLGHLQSIECLMEKGANLNLRIRGDSTALLLASRSGRRKVAELLIAGGAYVDATDQEGNTALLLAAQNGREEIVKLLLSRQGDIRHRNKRGCTALTLAAENGHVSVARTLLASGADANEKNSLAQTPLMVSAAKGHVGMVELLCSRGADVNVKDNKASTPLILAAKNGHDAVVKALLSKGADVRAQDWEGKTAFALASELGRGKVLDLLVPRGSGTVHSP